MQSTLKQDQTTRPLLFQYRYFLTKYNRLTTFIVPPSFLSNGSSPPSLSLSLSPRKFIPFMSLSILPSPLIFLPSSTPNHTGNFNCLPPSISIVNRISFTYEGHTANVDDGDAATPKLRRVGRAREIAVRLIARLGRPTANTPSYLVCDNGLGTRWQSVHVPRCAHRVNFVRQGAPLVSLVGRGPARRELLRG